MMVDGAISYESDDESVNTDDGSVTVTKVGDSYNFAFSNSIPNINGIEFEEENDEFYINVNGNETNYIRINESTLKILYVKDGKTWTENCTR